MSSPPVVNAYAYGAIGPADELVRDLAAEIMHDLQTYQGRAIVEPKARLLGKIARAGGSMCWPYCKPVVNELKCFRYYDLAAAADPFY